MLIISKNQSVITLRIDSKVPRTCQFLQEIGHFYFHPVSQPKNWSADGSCQYLGPSPMKHNYFSFLEMIGQLE